ncbi:hypothetical protein ACGFX2_29105 [Streptomyces goshikiensis]|uniref:hypothetical protein n=1 Tax=Streptomyces goshikiensis TaxID=1942 RepID=UPI003720A55C
MSAKNASQQLGIGFVGALLAGGLLLAACAAPGGRGHAREEGDTVLLRAPAPPSAVAGEAGPGGAAPPMVGG